MAFVNLSLLLGGLFTAIPIVLHLVMRREPTRQVSPALRFVQRRRETNQQRLQVRHWILLFLRCAAVALFAFALAQPSVDSLLTGKWVVVSGVGSVFLVASILLALAIVRASSPEAGVFVSTPRFRLLYVIWMV